MFSHCWCLLRQKYSNGGNKVPLLETCMPALRRIKLIRNRNVHCLDEENDKHVITDRVLQDIRKMLDKSVFQNEIWEDIEDLIKLALELRT